MTRSTVFWGTLAVATAVALFIVKDNVRRLETRLNELDAAIARDRGAVAVLDVEWAHLNRPARLEDMGRRLLGFDVPSAGQVVSLETFLEGAGAPDPAPGVRAASGISP